MKVKVLTMGITVLAISAMLAGASIASVPGAQNANKSKASAGKAAPTAAKPAASSGTTKPSSNTTTGAKKVVHRRVHHPAEAGIPSGGPGACVDRLSKLAEKDPLMAYEGEPSKIIDEGLLWNDPRSKCAISDPGQRDKVFAVATAWQEKNGDQLRSLLSDLKSALPPAEAKPAAMHKPRRHKAVGAGNKASNSNSAKK
jgi:hypothetical protein